MFMYSCGHNFNVAEFWRGNNVFKLKLIRFSPLYPILLLCIIIEKKKIVLLEFRHILPLWPRVTSLLLTQRVRVGSPVGSISWLRFFQGFPSNLGHIHPRVSYGHHINHHIHPSTDGDGL